VDDAEAEPEIRRVVARNPGPLTGPGTNTWILGRGTVAVVDPGPPDDPGHPAAVLAALGPGERVGVILVTHAHRDHCGAAPAMAQLTGAEICAHDAGLSGETGEPCMGWPRHPPLVADRLLTDGARVPVGRHVVSVLHIPGHHPGHLAFRVGTSVLTGDTVMGWASTMIAPPEGDLAAYRASLGRLRDLGASRFLPGHGDPVTDPAGRIEALLRHRAAREEAVLQALRDGPAPLSDLLAKVYADTPPALQDAAAGNLLAHLLDLARRGVVRPPPDMRRTATWALDPAASS